MKNKKRFIAGMITLTMVSAMAPLNAFATENTKTIDANTSSNNTDVKYSVDPSYTVVIPASITLSDTAATSTSISVDETAKPFKLAKGQKLSVKIANEDTNDFKVTNADDSLDYTVTAGSETLAKGSTAAEFSNDDKTDKTLTFSKMDASEAKYAGDYKGTLTFGISVENAAPANPYAANNVGDEVTFGSYNWYIIGKSDNGVTLLMKDNLENKKYNDSNTSVTWETCTLRTYLNDDFYNSFSADDKAKIVQKTNSNPNNGSISGGNDTTDYIYLLSIAEANALDDSVRNCGSRWWLRSPGFESYMAAGVNDGGNVDTDGYLVYSVFGVRPALNLEF